MAWETLAEAKLHRGKRTGWIYALLDPSTGIARYVGKTIDPLRREEDHCTLGSQPGNPKLENWKSELVSAGLAPEMVIIGMVSASNEYLFHAMIDDAEKAAIRQMNRSQRLEGKPLLFNIATVIPQRKIKKSLPKIHSM